MTFQFIWILKVFLLAFKFLTFSLSSLNLSLLGSSGQIIHNLQQLQQNTSKVSSKTDLPANLKRTASEKGFRISDNRGSGNCMFYALSEQLEIVKGIKIQHGELRQTLVQYLRKNPKLVS